MRHRPTTHMSIDPVALHCDGQPKHQAKFRPVVLSQSAASPSYSPFYEVRLSSTNLREPEYPVQTVNIPLIKTAHRARNQ